LANHKSALKRTRQNEVKRLRNKSNNTRIKHIIKELRLSVADGESKEALMKKFDAVKSAIDKGSKKRVFHRKTASRKISRLAAMINKAA